MTLDEAVEQASKIPGWMAPEELFWLGQKAEAYEKIVEVGCYRGRSTKVLALMSPGMVYAVDSLRGEVDPPPPQFGEPPMNGKELGAKFREALYDEIFTGKVQVVRKDSREAARLFKAKSVGFVFIDGDHEYPAPLEDIKTWAPKVAKGGLLAGHDSPHPGVEQALDEMGFHERGPDRIWFC